MAGLERHGEEAHVRRPSQSKSERTKRAPLKVLC